MKSKILMILMLAFALYVPTLTAQVIGSPPNSAENVQKSKTITVEDIQTFRKIAAERDALAKQCDELKRQCDEWKESSANWQSLYEKEKFRADVVQEKRIDELKNAVDKADQANFTLNAANAQLHVQHREDMARIGALETDNRKLKKDRWKYGLTGFSLGAGTGFAAGFYIGNQVSPPNLFIGGGIGGKASNRLASFDF